MMRRTRLALALTAGLFLAGGIAAAGTSPGAGAAVRSASVPNVASQARVAAGDSPAGFGYGSDSWPVPVTGHPPYQLGHVGGNYGGYIGMTGSWSYWLGCRGSFLAWAPANSRQANINYARGIGIGTGAYWFMGGPGVDPSYTGTTTEAYAWGQRQAERAVADANGQAVTYRVMFIDVELPGVAPATDNGWNSVYTSPCSGRVRTYHIPASVDRADFNGFWNYIKAHGYTPGVYSEPGVWASIFGTGTASRLSSTYEWTYEPETTNLSAAPAGWCLKRTSSCAQFFGGVTRSSRYALMWQWSGGGGVRNPYGDFDQVSTGTIR
jgi:hypothetical protein